MLLSSVTEMKVLTTSGLLETHGEPTGVNRDTLDSLIMPPEVLRDGVVSARSLLMSVLSPHKSSTLPPRNFLVNLYNYTL